MEPIFLLDCAQGPLFFIPLKRSSIVRHGEFPPIPGRVFLWPFSEPNQKGLFLSHDKSQPSSIHIGDTC
jgi:hypothetical protein